MTENPPSNAGKPNEAATASVIVVAHRHVAEFEQRVERQKRLIERLERDKHVKMLGEARKVLETLEQSLGLARQHLQIEIDRHG